MLTSFTNPGDKPDTGGHFDLQLAEFLSSLVQQNRSLAHAHAKLADSIEEVLGVPAKCRGGSEFNPAECRDSRSSGQ